ncbi:ankyrin repeat-containing protein BDA1-like [Durio zibethinus]|uniref:Ankyrin repeat-containing protein BDA1-like n=1 Tax=Durio zibethinus TaxID=66656 RepID=A0A6P5Z634_DURZI|nr:ankyrin repeat-containing protein BDA1-like [Durio zibethinus]
MHVQGQTFCFQGPEMEEKEPNGIRRLEAGETGSIESLYEIIHQDAFILERIDQVPFIDTPLHKAASAGHIAFAIEMMTLKPSFFRKLNPDGLSPMHLALRNDRFQWVLMLSKIDKSLLRVKAREGMTPFHYVVEKGNLNLIKQFLEISPECTIDLTVKGETALHIALKEDRVEALVYIVHWLHRRCFQYVENAEYWPRKVLNWGDLEGNTVLHVAAKRNESQVVKRLLLTNQIDKEARNSEGLTALDIIERERHRNLVNNDEIRLMLCRSVQNLKFSGFGQPKAFFAKIINNFFHIEVALCRASLNMRNETRSAFLVVAGLILAATYNASLNPPGGLWTSADRSASMNISSNHTLNGTSSSPQHMPGTSITGEAQFFLFWTLLRHFHGNHPSNPSLEFS